MNRLPVRQLSLVLLFATLIGLVCAADFLTPLGVAIGVVYIVPVLATLWMAGRGITMGVASSATFLIILKFVIAPQSGIPWMVLSNRAISVFVVWATALLVLQRKRNEQTLEEQKDALQLEINERKCMQAAMEQSNKRITHILLTVTDPFFVLDREFRIVETNPQAEFYLKRSGPDLLGQSIWSVLPRGTVFESQFRLAMGGQEVSFETVSSLDKGHWVAIHVFPITAGVSVYLRDTTEMKLLRNLVSEQAQELGETKAVLARMAQRHPEST